MVWAKDTDLGVSSICGGDSEVVRLDKVIFQLGVILPRGHLAMIRNIFDCHSWGI